MDWKKDVLIKKVSPGKLQKLGRSSYPDYMLRKMEKNRPRGEKTNVC